MEAQQERASTASPEQDAPDQTVGAPENEDNTAPAEEATKQQPRRQEQDSAVLKLKGLPYTTTEAQIYEFFTGFNIVRVAFVFEPDGRPSGLAFAEFASREEALQAMSRNGEYIGERYVRLLHVPRQEMEEQVRMGTLAIPGQAARLRQRMLRVGMGMAGPPHFAAAPHMGHGGRGHILGHLHGAYALPQHAMLHGMQPMQPLHPHHMLAHGVPMAAAPSRGQMLHGQQQQGRGPVVQPAGSSLQAPQQQRQQQQRQQQQPPQQEQQLQEQEPQQQQHQQHRPHHQQQQQPQPPGMGAAGPSMPGMALPPHMALVYQMGGLSLGPPHGRVPGGPPGQNPPGPPHLPPPPMPGAYAPRARPLQPAPVPFYSTDSKTVKIRGLPFRATPLDILRFFEGYSYVANSLQLGVDALGRPSGEAWLGFGSSEEALRAVRERNRAYLGQRYLELSLT